MVTGCYCLTTDFKAIKPENWDNSVHEPQGVLVVSESWRPFVMGLNWGGRLPWAEKGGVDFQDFGTLILDPLDATKEIVRRHKEAGIAAPAAEWCLDYSYRRIGKGRWALPTQEQCLSIFRYQDQIQQCLYCLTVCCAIGKIEVWTCQPSQKRYFFGRCAESFFFYNGDRKVRFAYAENNVCPVATLPPSMLSF